MLSLRGSILFCLLQLLWCNTTLFVSARISKPTFKMTRHHRVKVGSSIPSAPSCLPTLDGTSVRLTDDQIPTVLTFLRHLAWLIAVTGPRNSTNGTSAGDTQVRVIFVSYADASKPLQRMWIEEWNRKYCSSSKATLVLDPNKAAYEAFQIPSSLAAGWGLANTWYYVKAIVTFRTRSVQVRGEAGQLGADFVLAPGEGGRCVLAHYCRNPTDRVPVDNIVEALRSVK